MFNLTYEFKLKPTHTQIQIFEEWLEINRVYFQKVDSRKTSQICPNCGVETGKKELSERTHVCLNCGYTTDRDVAATQVVLIEGLQP